jgi:hypothetical protein
MLLTSQTPLRLAASACSMIRLLVSQWLLLFTAIVFSLLKLLTHVLATWLKWPTCRDK